MDLEGENENYTRRLRELKEILTICLNKNAILSSLFYRGPGGLFITFKRR